MEASFQLDARKEPDETYRDNERGYCQCKEPSTSCHVPCIPAKERAGAGLNVFRPGAFAPLCRPSLGTVLQASDQEG